MRVLLAFVLVLVVGTLEAGERCEKICGKFLYENPNWEYHSNIDDTYFEVSVSKGDVSGVLTTSFDKFPCYNDSKKRETNGDYLRFLTQKREYGRVEVVLSMKIAYNEDSNTSTISLRGKEGEKVVGVDENELAGRATYVQFSDKYPDYYMIFLEAGDRGQDSMVVSYNYLSEERWNQLQISNKTLYNTVRIQNTGECTVYKYISACSDPTPRLCDEEQTVSKAVHLGSSYTLSCTGSGAPHLDVDWTKDGEPTDLKPKTVLTTSEPDNRIESTLTLVSVTINDLGTWNCRIHNRNFNDSITKSYTLHVQVALLEAPRLGYYREDDRERQFRWVVQGWPLEQVKLDCSTEANVTKSITGNNTICPLITPKSILTLTLKNDDPVYCTLKDGEQILDIRQMTRVGYNCEAGEGGIDYKGCEVCPTGQTSTAGFGECSPARSMCGQGYWGKESSCKPCPENQTSRLSAVKIQECFPDISYCGEGRYGYGVDCNQCPYGKTSLARTKVEAECFIPEAFKGKNCFFNQVYDQLLLVYLSGYYTIRYHGK